LAGSIRSARTCARRAPKPHDLPWRFSHVRSRGIDRPGPGALQRSTHTGGNPGATPGRAGPSGAECICCQDPGGVPKPRRPTYGPASPSPRPRPWRISRRPHLFRARAMLHENQARREHPLVQRDVSGNWGTLRIRPWMRAWAASATWMDGQPRNPKGNFSPPMTWILALLRAHPASPGTQPESPGPAGIHPPPSRTAQPALRHQPSCDRPSPGCHLGRWR